MSSHHRPGLVETLSQRRRPLVRTSTRRDILKQTCTLALGVAGTSRIERTAHAAAPVPTGPRLRGSSPHSLVRHDETILQLGGLGDGFEMTWAADDRQYVVVNDGTGWGRQTHCVLQHPVVDHWWRPARCRRIFRGERLSRVERPHAPGECPSLLWPWPAGGARLPLSIPHHSRSGYTQAKTLDRSEAHLLDRQGPHLAQPGWASAGIGCAPDGTEFGKPSYLGFWVSPTPWGSWRQIHEESAWTPGNDPDARAYAPRIAPKWLAPDGKSFWLVWADLKGMLTFARDEPLLDAAIQKADSPLQRTAVQVDFLRRYMPRYALNAQRVNLMLP